MIGISWGGFNGLQFAARRPPALKAVISLCSTDDRYADDVHFMGGCLLVDKLAWGSTMFSLNTAPPDPTLVGDNGGKCGWPAGRFRLVARRVASASAPRCLLRAWLGRRGLVLHPMSGVSRRRLGRWLHQPDFPLARQFALSAKRPHRTLGAQVSEFRKAGTANRLSPGMPALVGQMAERRRNRRHGRADGQRLDQRTGPAQTNQ